MTRSALDARKLPELACANLFARSEPRRRHTASLTQGWRPIGKTEKSTFAAGIEMNIIIGLVLTIGCILGGFIAMGGHMEVLNQPFELVIIGGAGIGGYVMANSMKVLKD